MDLRAVANLLESLRIAGPQGEDGVGPDSEVSEDGYAASFVREALGRLPLADLCMLASRLSAGPWRDGARLIWDAVVSGLRVPT